MFANVAEVGGPLVVGSTSWDGVEFCSPPSYYWRYRTTRTSSGSNRKLETLPLPRFGHFAPGSLNNILTTRLIGTVSPLYCSRLFELPDLDANSDCYRPILPANNNNNVELIPTPQTSNTTLFCGMTITNSRATLALGASFVSALQCCEAISTLMPAILIL